MARTASQEEEEEGEAFWLRSPGSVHETGCLGLVHWDDPEGWDGERGGREVQDGEYMYTHGGFM